MTNFDFLLSDARFAPFAGVAAAAEQILSIDPSAAVINCRRAMEFAVKWMYSVDGALVLPYDDRLVCLMDSGDFRDIVGQDLWKRMEFIRSVGNRAAHNSKQISREQAALCIENLHVFLDFIAYCYGEQGYEPVPFDPALLDSHQPVAMPVDDEIEIRLQELIRENEALREELTARRQVQQSSYTPKPIDMSEAATRQIYIDEMLLNAGWIEGRDWRNEVEVQGMPNRSGIGRIDYVLYDDMQRPLAIIEAKRACADIARGREQASIYADILEKQYHRRPVIFLTNGFETRIIDGQYPERRVAAIYSKRDLEKLFNLRSMRASLKNVMVNREIAGRYYQEGAIKAVCDAFGEKNRRKALLVMATGSGKTRTIMGLCDVLIQRGWVKNILFLADRNSLVTQAKRSFVNWMPNLSVTNLCEEKDNYHARCVFSTYQTMMNCIDSVHDEEGKLFTCGHFDLVICDEAHRSIYNKYREIFTYFDAPLVGLTATPKEDIEKNTYEIFELESGVPTYGYDLAQAVQDGFLVPYMAAETRVKFLEQGISYDELSEEEKREYEDTFADEDGEMPNWISSSALNEWIFNEDTIREVLHVLMEKGLRIEYGEKLGKTIIFARNHRHAEKIFEVFGKEYPHLPSYAKVIDNQTNYAQHAIDEFSEGNKLPQIAISVDMLDTGIDVPEVLNLVFFKKVMSRAKFWQMIGRGTRLCKELLDGKDKEKFYIFDCCGNFEFFRMSGGREVAKQLPLQGAIFNLKAQMLYKLQNAAVLEEGMAAFREKLVSDMVSKVQELNLNNFAVQQHLRYVERYKETAGYTSLSYEDTLLIASELAPLITPDHDDAKAIRFDALMYGIELAHLDGKKYTRARNDLLKKVKAISELERDYPEIALQHELIHRILDTDYLERASVCDFEHIRQSLRDLMKCIPQRAFHFDTHFDDEILSVDWSEAELENDDLKNYKAKAEFYIRQHQEHLAIAKLKTNKPLNRLDIESLERILWNEVGSREDYEAEYGEKPLGEFVREIVGLDMKAAKEAFAVFLNDAYLDSRQIYFVNQIVEYVVRNGLMKDFSVMQESPFTDQGSVVELFPDLTIWQNIRQTIKRINDNAVAAS